MLAFYLTLLILLDNSWLNHFSTVTIQETATMGEGSDLEGRWWSWRKISNGFAVNLWKWRFFICYFFVWGFPLIYLLSQRWQILLSHDASSWDNFFLFDVGWKKMIGWVNRRWLVLTGRKKGRARVVKANWLVLRWFVRNRRARRVRLPLKLRWYVNDFHFMLKTINIS